MSSVATPLARRKPPSCLSVDTPSLRGVESGLLDDEGQPDEYSWLGGRLVTGEAATWLALSGSFAVALTPAKVGTRVEYTLRDKIQLPGMGALSLIAVTPTFEYLVLSMHGAAKGRAVVFKPCHDAHSLVVAFRGMRVKSGIVEEDIGPNLDRASLAKAEAVSAKWLASGSVHAGVLEHHESMWELGLRQSLADLAADARRCEHLREILFVGLSLGGALAEMTACRTALAFPSLRTKLHVLSFGSIAWADAAAGATYVELLSQRSVQLVLSRRAVAPAPAPAPAPSREPSASAPSATAAASSPSATAAASAPAAPAAASTPAGTSPPVAPDPTWWVRDGTPSGFVAFDPLVVSCRGSPLRPLASTTACSQEGSSADATATALLDAVSLERDELRRFVSGSLPAGHPLLADYDQLHYGARYRDFLVQMLRKKQVSEWCRRIASVPLQGPWPSHERIRSSALWAERACVVFVVRRLGCPLCRELVAGLLTYEDEFDEADADVVIIASQETGAEEVATGRFLYGAGGDGDERASHSPDAPEAGAPAEGAVREPVQPAVPPSAAQQRMASAMRLKVFVDEKRHFHQLLGGRKVPAMAAMRPDVLARAAVNAVKFGARLDDINEMSDYLGGTLVIHPTMGVLHSHEETEDFRNMTAEDLLSTVKTLLTTVENAFAMMAM